MTEQASEPRDVRAQAGVPSADPAQGAIVRFNAYLRWVDRIRIAAAGFMALSGAVFVVCGGGPRTWEPNLGGGNSGIWAWVNSAAFVCLLAGPAAIVTIVVERLARPDDPSRFSVSSVCLRAMVIGTSSLVLGLSLAISYGPWQAIGGVSGALFAFGAIKQQGSRRICLGILAVIFLACTLLGTQTAYQFARRHAAQIVAAGWELADQFRTSGDGNRVPHPQRYNRFGREIDPGDRRVPSVLRDLGVKRIWLDDELVGVYCEGRIEFHIYHQPRSRYIGDTLWLCAKSPSVIRIADRLWLIEDN